MWRVATILAAVLAVEPALARTPQDTALERAYFQLSCMLQLQVRLDDGPDAAARTAMLEDQAWIVVEVSGMAPARIQALYAAAGALAARSTAFHACLTADPPA